MKVDLSWYCLPFHTKSLQIERQVNVTQDKSFSVSSWYIYDNESKLLFLFCLSSLTKGVRTHRLCHRCFNSFKSRMSNAAFSQGNYNNYSVHLSMIQHWSWLIRVLMMCVGVTKNDYRKIILGLFYFFLYHINLYRVVASIVDIVSYGIVIILKVWKTENPVLKTV